MWELIFHLIREILVSIIKFILILKLYQTFFKKTIHGSTERFDLGLAKRTVANMTYFFDVLSEKSELVKNNIDQILLLNRMKISDKPEDASAELYFFGFLEKNGKIEAIKTHFLTRFCKDVDQVDTKDEYRDDYYLDFLADTHISAFLTLVPFVKNVLRQCGGHLWMIGVDYFSNGSVKYRFISKSEETNYTMH